MRALREERRHTVRSLSARLAELGRPILPSGISKIEDRSRRVDVGDLVALAVAMGVNPNRLLLPVDPNAEVALTPTVTAKASGVWDWARGDDLLIEAVAETDDDRLYGEALDDFRRHALPTSVRLREDHTAVRAAQDVLRSLRAVLDRRDHPEKFGGDVNLLTGGPATSTPAGLRRELARLVAEVDALIGDRDGQRQ